MHAAAIAAIAQRENEPGQLLTKTDVARFCRVSVFTVNRWTSQRIGPKFYRLNRRIVFKLPDVMAFVDEHAVMPVGEQRMKKRTSRSKA